MAFVSLLNLSRARSRSKAILAFSLSFTNLSQANCSFLEAHKPVCFCWCNGQSHTRPVEEIHELLAGIIVPGTVRHCPLLVIDLITSLEVGSQLPVSYRLRWSIIVKPRARRHRFRDGRRSEVFLPSLPEVLVSALLAQGPSQAIPWPSTAAPNWTCQGARSLGELSTSSV